MSKRFAARPGLSNLSALLALRMRPQYRAVNLCPGDAPEAGAAPYAVEVAPAIIPAQLHQGATPCAGSEPRASRHDHDPASN